MSVVLNRALDGVVIVTGLKQGNEALKEIQGQIDLDELDKIMEETQEAAEFQKVCSLFHVLAPCLRGVQGAAINGTHSDCLFVGFSFGSGIGFDPCRLIDGGG